MIGIVIVAHGSLAQEYLKAIEHVMGGPTGICAISIEGEYDRAQKEAEICAAADAADLGEGVLIVTDIFGGSPSNLSLKACQPRNRRILYGANLPMLLKLAKSRHMTVADAARAALDSARKYIDSHNEKPQSGDL